MNTSLLTIIWSMLAATSLILGFMNTVLWVRGRGPALLLAAIMAVASGFLAFNELFMMNETEIGPFQILLKLSNLLVALVLVAMVWYIHLRLGTGRRWLAVTISAVWVFCLVVNFMSPASLVFREIETLRRLPTFWGEEFTIPLGPANPFKYVADAASLLIMIYVIDASVRAWRRGRRYAAAVIGGSISLFIVVAGIYTPLVDAGLVPTPSIISIAFLAILLALSWEITRDAARTREISRELERTQREMDRLLRANLLGEFASTIAHELNQPLTAVLANAQVARRYLAADPPQVMDVQEMLDLIIRDDKRAAEVIQRLHGMVTKGKVVREALDLNEVVRDMADLCDKEMLNRGVGMELDLDQSLPQVMAGRVELQQVVLNLLHNSLQALSSGSADPRKILIATRTLPDAARISVEDSGPGLPDIPPSSLFSPFNGHRVGGVGMGLAICRRIVEAYGGSIRAESAPRGGACFVVELPAC